MKYIVFPSSNLNAIPQEMLDELHLTPRKSVDGTQVIMKLDHYEKLFPSIMTLPLLDEEKTENPIYPYPTYEGEELNTLLSGPEWSSSESII
ncbi:hypothetical protein KSZ88_19595 [Bacteroides thetaiotaomicron]|jgi:hypothetical protein|uniref:Uncharacterized protein n=1 Tax=Bacteroides thetaiotaomicron TaxID=818 RepID=A0ABD7U7R4_BACT4|nr:hypothetical protein [Bacteroides thetaiotaomicron]MBU9008976.1 hypothetical protein [Bacteroides thetaiotaomicron]MBU9075261.1 hypothetical protein [Bacteroides thetaiotaomicron]MBV4263733.1 hypothetical protein [Bacteroides thetaiotaomicron]MCB7309763.1 hypothetical protein [Bacteroides thetaiotaomicron]MCG4873183.1 hypothetical protein [Bacteroides thetaiotaomicron]